MKVYFSEQIRKGDLFTIENEPILSVELMERAGKKCVARICEVFPEFISFLIFCGPGNNGGDGFVIARLLKNEGKDVKLISFGESSTDENKEQKERWLKSGGHIIEYKKWENNYSDEELIIDCIFGNGLKRKPEDDFAECIRWINANGKNILSIDFPSGAADTSVFDQDTVIKATHTFTFQYPKPFFYMADTGIFCGQLSVIDIGLKDAFFKKEIPWAKILCVQDIAPNFPKRNPFSHKGHFGHAVLIGGSFGMSGAMVIATGACLRSGAGLTTVYAPVCSSEILQSKFPEAMLGKTEGKDFIEKTGNFPSKTKAIGIGTGMIGADLKVLENVFDCRDTTKILDAEALNMISANKKYLEKLDSNYILTPHPKEFERLSEKFYSSFDMIEKQKEFSMKHRCVIVLKGRFTSITDADGNLYLNTTGNAGLAKGGSGDMLTGIITSFAAQGFSPFEAACFGCYIHGLAADLAVKDIQEMGLLATDVILRIPDAIRKIQTE